MKLQIYLSIFLCCVISGCSINSQIPTVEKTFTLVVIPDTQNAIDFTRQKAEGFAIDSSEIFIQQMQYIASKGMNNGGNVAFVASVGDVWQHLSSDIDPEHFARGITSIENPILSSEPLIKPKETIEIEIPKAIEGYQLISDAGIPFGVAPGNHDYDATWSVSGFPPNLDKEPGTHSSTVEDLGLLHIGGLRNFRSAFGSDTEFFRNKDWYVSGYNGGGSSAQLFSAGGYRFLHFAFEMQAGDKVLAWAQAIIDQHKDLPTIISTHDYLNSKGERKPISFFDLALADPSMNNNAETIWKQFIRHNDQIFLVLSGHQLGQAMRVDDNLTGHKVYQLLADYQERGQAGIDAGQALNNQGKPVGIGDGWYREMVFHLGGEHPRVDVNTYSSHYKTYSNELNTYASWYKNREQPNMSDLDFLKADDFTIELDDFYVRFGKPVTSP